MGQSGRRKRNTPKTEKDSPSNGRIHVQRGLPPTPGAENIIVVKRGEDLQANLKSQLEMMENDREQVEFWWTKGLTDPQFSESREHKEYAPTIMKWEMEYGIRNLPEYRAKIRRLKVLIDHFNPGYDYELTVAEVVEIQS
jgi:hypothetical protein